MCGYRLKEKWIGFCSAKVSEFFEIINKVLRFQRYKAPYSQVIEINFHIQIILQSSLQCLNQNYTANSVDHTLLTILFFNFLEMLDKNVCKISYCFWNTRKCSPEDFLDIFIFNLNIFCLSKILFKKCLHCFLKHSWIYVKLNDKKKSGSRNQ